MGEMSAYMKTS